MNYPEQHGVDFVAKIRVQRRKVTAENPLRYFYFLVCLHSPVEMLLLMCKNADKRNKTDEIGDVVGNANDNLENLLKVIAKKKQKQKNNKQKKKKQRGGFPGMI